MSLFKKILIVLLVCGAVSIIFLAWYSVQHSNDEAVQPETRVLLQPQRVLLATEDADSKDSVVRRVIQQLESRQITIAIYRMSDLKEITQSEWAAIIVFQKSEPPLKDSAGIASLVRTFGNSIWVRSGSRGSFLVEAGHGTDPVSVSESTQAADKIVEQVALLLDKR
jgi:hypothetical protein